MAAAGRSAFVGPLALCFLLLTLFLIAATVVLALIPVYLKAKGNTYNANQLGLGLTAGYASDAKGAGSDTIADGGSANSQLLSQSGVPAGQVGVTGSNFIPTKAAARKKRQTFNSDGTVTCETVTGLTGDIFVGQYQMLFPTSCLGFCRTRYRNKIIGYLRKNYQRFTITVNFTIAGIKPVTLVFCGIFESNSVGCTPETRTNAYLIGLSNILYQFNPTSLAITAVGPINCSSSSFLYSIALQRNGILWASFLDGSLFKYNLRSNSCTPTSFVGNQTGFAPYSITFLQNTTDNSETLFASKQVNTSAALARIDTNTLNLSIVGTYSKGLDTYTDNAGLNDGRLFGVFARTPYVIAQIDPTNANILAQYPLNHSSQNGDQNYAFTVFNTRFFFFAGNGSFSDLLTYDLSTNTTTFQYTIPQVIYSATSSSCLGT